MEAPTKGGYAYGKWPVSNPGLHGFDDWHSTEASASSSTTNCDCNPEWGKEAPGCISGGGAWGDKGNGCTNYWTPLKGAPASCLNISEPKTILAQHCVGNLTTKITGDDSEYIVDRFEDFVKAKAESRTPFMAVVWLHTVHEPHPALPEFYHNYTDAFGDPAGDYLGTITQMDVQIGRIRAILEEQGVRDDTMVWFTADNGPHTADRDRNEFPGLSATNGLRQCKASLYEGGLRVPGILEWPAMIKQNSQTWHPSYVSDYMPTLLEVMGVPHEHPTWAADGVSLMPLIRALASTPAVNDTTPRSSADPLVFALGTQRAIIDNQWKLLKDPVVGQCNKEHGSIFKGTGLFNLDNDPTESHNLAANPAYASIIRNMTAQLAAFDASVTHSQQDESECQPKAPGPSPGPAPAPPPLFVLKASSGGKCLIMNATGAPLPSSTKGTGPGTGTGAGAGAGAGGGRNKGASLVLGDCSTSAAKWYLHRFIIFSV